MSDEDDPVIDDSDDTDDTDDTDDGYDPRLPHDQDGSSVARDHAVTDVADGDGDDGLFPAPVTAAPWTGDPVIDEALAGLEESARSGDLDAQVESGERVHRELQGRLDDLGGA